jgi:hypothetical protein
MNGKWYKDKRLGRNKGRRGSIMLSYKAHKEFTFLSSTALSL